MALTKTEIIERIAAKNNLKPTETKKAVEELIEVMKSNLASGEDLLISGFGKFCVQEKAPRKGRNPATGDSMTIKKRRIITFRCFGKLRDLVNGQNKS